MTTSLCLHPPRRAIIEQSRGVRAHGPNAAVPARDSLEPKTSSRRAAGVMIMEHRHMTITLHALGVQVTGTSNECSFFPFRCD